MKRSLDNNDLAFLSLFENTNRVQPLDYVDTDGMVTFLVDPRDLGRAIGKKAGNIRKLERRFKKKVVIVPKHRSPEGFARAFFKNVRIVSIEIREAMGDRAMFLTINEEDRGIALGKSGNRIKTFKEFLRRLFDGMTLVLKSKRIAGDHV